jgi:RNA polymerase sigma-70 factor (ECF subfamily)
MELAPEALADDRKLADYSFYWAARADVGRRAGRRAEARALYGRAVARAKSHAERAAYQRMMSELEV